MIIVLIGLGLGVALALLPIPVVHNALTELTAVAYDKMIDVVDPQVTNSTWKILLVAMLTAAVPGLLTLVAAAGLKAERVVRGLLGAVLLVASIFAWVYLPPSAALMLTGLAIACAAAYFLASNVLVALPLAAFVGLGATTAVLNLLLGPLDSLLPGATAMNLAMGGSLQAWQLFLAVVACIPLLITLQMLLSTTSTVDE